VPERIYREAREQQRIIARTSDPESGSDSDSEAGVAGASYSEM